MEHFLQKDQKYKKILRVVQVIYLITGLAITAHGMMIHSSYEIGVSLGTLALFPAFYLLRRCFRLQGSWQLETYIYVFSYLGWTLGGAASVYNLVPYYDKFVHCLSGVFVSVLALALYRILEGNRGRSVTACFFVFFTSMAVAGMFELCEFALTPIAGRDLQHVLDSGVTDTMMDMLVCLVGTLVFVLLMIRRAHGKYDPLTDAAEVFAYRNFGEKRENKVVDAERKFEK